MTSIADGSVKIQTTSESNPSTPSWFGEVVLISQLSSQARCSEQDQRAGALCADGVSDTTR